MDIFFVYSRQLYYRKYSDYFFSSQLRKENIQLMKNQDDFKFFREAIAHHDLEIEEVETD